LVVDPQPPKHLGKALARHSERPSGACAFPAGAGERRAYKPPLELLPGRVERGRTGGGISGDVRGQE